MTPALGRPTVTVRVGYAQSGQRKKRLIAVFASLGLLLVLLFASVVFAAWVILHTHGPRFVLQDVTINKFNFSQPNYLSSNLQVTISSHNPNHKIGIYYDRLHAYALYRNQKVTVSRLLPTTYQGQMEDTVWSPVLSGSEPLASNLIPQLKEDLITGLVPLNIKIEGSARWEVVDSWVSSPYSLRVTCPVVINFSGQLVDPGSSKVKYQTQFVDGCDVNL